MLVFGIAGGKKVRGDSSLTRVRIQQVPKNGNRLESVITCPGNAPHALYPGQFLEIERATVEAAFGEPLKISSAGSDFYILRNPGTSGPPYVLADAPVLFPVTRTVEIIPDAEMTVHDRIFRSVYGVSRAPSEGCFVLQNIGNNFVVKEICREIGDRLQDGIRISYVSGGHEAVERRTVSQNLSILSGDDYMFARVMGKMKMYPGRPSWTFSVLIDPQTGELGKFVYPEENNNGQGVKLVQDIATRRINSFSFFHEREAQGFLRYIMECTVNFYNRLRAVSP